MPHGSGSEIGRAIDAAHELVRNARRVPFADQVRIKRRKLEAAIAHIRVAAAAEGVEAEDGFTSALQQLVRVAAGARAIPLTSDVRVDPLAMTDALNTLRALVR